jgi:serine/threonine protein kinase/tetratricopeptide (TPR) repeat protein
MIDAQDWGRLKELFISASEMDAAERRELLDGVAADDPGIAARLGTLLDAHDRSGGFLEDRVAREAEAMIEEAASSAWIGRRLGAYAIVRLLGRGGMGMVFLGERVDGSFVKHVAVKVVGAPVASESLLRRFAVERQTLAQLEHPNIARLLDGGATPDGFPYLVMEYVPGEPIDRHCELHGLDVDARLRLFLDVCGAVEHAHRNLVVHRDLKPSNILVTPDGTVKLLDFGIAKLLEIEPGGASYRTRTEAAALTPEYASPEQVRREPITTSCDVYTLGLLLHRLLTGEHPYTFPDTSLAAAARVICDEAPERPSDALARRARSDGDPSAARRARRLRGDLDNIVLTALRKEPSRRYSSVDALAADVRRHLDGLPVQARGDSVAYRAAKFVRRHRVPVAAAAVVLLSLVVGIVATARQAERARHEARLANEQRDRAEAMSTFLQGMLGAADASAYSAGRGRGVATTVAEVLDRAAERAGTDFKGRPEAEAAIRTTLGKTYRTLGILDASETQLRRAVELERRLVGEHDPEFADTSAWLAATLAAKGKADEAEPILRDAVAILRASLPERAGRLAMAVNELGLVRWSRGDAAGAETLFLEVIDLTRRYVPGGHPVAAAALGNLGLVRDAHGDLDGAIRFYREALAALKALPESKPVEIAISTANIATALRLRGQYDESERLARESLDLFTAALGADNATFVAPSWTNLAELHRLEGRFADAEREVDGALATLHAKLPPEHPMTAWAEGVRGMILTDTGRAAAGEPSLRRALELARHIFAPRDRRTALAAIQLGHCLTVERKFGDAEPLLVDGARDLEAALGPDHPRTRLARTWIAELKAQENAAHGRSTYR